MTVCLLGDGGAPLVDSQTLSAGARVGPFNATHFRLDVDTGGVVKVKLDNKIQRLAPKRPSSFRVNGTAISRSRTRAGPARERPRRNRRHGNRASHRRRSPTATARGWPSGSGSWGWRWRISSARATAAGDLESTLGFLAGDGVDLIVTSGGLGPTADDLTAEVVGRFAGRPLELDEEMEQKIAAIIAGFARRMNFDPDALREANRKQAMVPQGRHGNRPGRHRPGAGRARGGRARP